ncbi:MAG TPA: nucleotidyltransferase domain-containing protein [Candidatus Brocadiaceae bacterium]|nr:nucleotidyltransferase domain-containing protein [Candidatus Brocadiaceae bacterium]
MVDAEIRTIVEMYLQTVVSNGVMVTRGIIFGSQAKGNAGVWSDIDLLVVSPRFDVMSGRGDINLLWRIAARTDSRIEPIPCGEKQWLEDDSSPIIEIARREGEIVMPAAVQPCRLG